MAKQQFNRRLPDESITAINWWAKQDGVTDTEIVVQAIAFYDEMRGNGGEVATEASLPVSRVDREPFASQAGRSVAEKCSGLTDPSTIPGVTRGLPEKAPVIIKRYRCEHCGAFPAVPRVGDICETCRGGGHVGDIRSCPECWQPS